MGHHRLQPLATLALLALAAASPTSRRTTVEGPHPVSSKLLTLTDTKRSRDLPIKIYYPADATAPCPVILFSHGLGGSREGYAYLGRALASHGYVAIHPSHPGSDTDSLLKSPNPLAAAALAASDPSNLLNRPLDLSFLIDQLPTLDESDPDLKGKLDPKTVGAAGHSFGAYTVMAVIGQRFPTPGGDRSFADPRIAAAIAMSSPTPQRNVDFDRVYARIDVPCFHMTGTLDDMPFSNSKAPQRRIPFDHSPHPDTYLLTFTGGDHMTFSGRANRHIPGANGTTVPLRTLPGTSADPATDAIFQPLIARAAVAFFDAHLKKDPAAQRWLTTDFPTLLATHGTFERKPTNAPTSP